MGDFIDCGLDIVNPIQVSCTGMRPAELKARFGGKVVFFGGAYDAVDTPPGTAPETVYHAVCENITALGEGGGYLFGGVHNSPSDTPEGHLQAIPREP